MLDLNAYENLNSKKKKRKKEESISENGILIKSCQEREGVNKHHLHPLGKAISLFFLLFFFLFSCSLFFVFFCREGESQEIGNPPALPAEVENKNVQLPKPQMMFWMDAV